MVTQIFGDMLYCPESGLEEFPSPEALKHKIILSTKPPKEYLGSNNVKDGEIPSPHEKDSSEEDGSDHDEEDVDAFQEKADNVAAPEYKRLIGIHAGNAKKGLRNALRRGTDKVNRLSLSEQRLEKAASLYATDVVRYIYCVTIDLIIIHIL